MFWASTITERTAMGNRMKQRIQSEIALGLNIFGNVLGGTFQWVFQSRIDDCKGINVSRTHTEFVREVLSGWAALQVDVKITRRKTLNSFVVRASSRWTVRTNKPQHLTASRLRQGIEQISRNKRPFYSSSCIIVSGVLLLISGSFPEFGVNVIWTCLTLDCITSPRSAVIKENIER